MEEPPHPASQRRTYEHGELHAADLAAGPMHVLSAWLAEAMDSASGSRLEATAMALATAEPDGLPSVRMVLCKAVHEHPAAIDWYTNLRSRKARELALNGHAAVVFWWPQLERQVRASGVVEPISAAEADAYFASRPRGSQLAAHASRNQSDPIASRAALDLQLQEVGEQYPGEVPVDRPDGWGGHRLQVEQVELWQGRPGRLHDRFRFDRVAGAAPPPPLEHAVEVVDDAGEVWLRVRLQP